MKKRIIHFLLAGILALTLAINVGAAAEAIAATHYLSIPAAAFTPSEPFLDYQNHGRYLILYGNNSPTSNGTGSFSAPVTLPQGAILKRFTLYYRDTTLPGSANADLLATQHFTNLNYVMAQLKSVDVWGVLSGQSVPIPSKSLRRSTTPPDNFRFSPCSP